MSITKTIIPNDQVSLWKENSLVTCDINLVGQEQVLGSLRVSGDFYTNFSGAIPNGGAGTAAQAGSTLTIDPIIGAHSFFSDWAVSTDLLGNLPVNTDYGRVVKQYRWSNLDKNDLPLLGKEMCGISDFTFYDGKSFEITPMIDINSSNKNLSYEKVGNMRIQVWLPAFKRIFATTNTNPNLTYGITNLKFHIDVMPSSGYKGPVELDTYYVETPSLVTPQQTIMSNVGNMDVKAVSISFQNISAPSANYYAFDNIQPQQIGFQLNDLINGLTSFNLKQPSEIAKNGLSLNRNGYEKYYPDASDQNSQVSLVGVAYPSLLNAAENKFSVFIQSAAPNNGNVFTAHVVYSGIREY